VRVPVDPVTLAADESDAVGVVALERLRRVDVRPPFEGYGVTDLSAR